MTPAPSAQVAAAIVQFLDPGVNLRKLTQLAHQSLADDAVLRHVTLESYRAADQFAWNPEFARTRKVSWLGVSTMSGLPGVPGSQRVTCAHILVENTFHGTVSLHQHYLLDARVRLDDPRDEELTSLIAALHSLYWVRDRRGRETAWLRDIDPFTSYVQHTKQGLSSRRFYYASLLLDPDQWGTVERWEQVAPAVYGLLHLHASGVGSEAALKSLRASAYGSTSFFTGFFHADSLLTISVPYPPGAAGYDLGAIARSGNARDLLVSWNAMNVELGDRFEAYDLTPDFPLVRYNALTLIEYAGNASFALWWIRRSLSRIHSRPWLLGVVSSVWSYRQIDAAYYRATSLEVIRLPSVRAVAWRFIGSRVIDESQRVIDGLRASLLNGLIVLLTAAALLVGIIQVAVAVLGE